MWIFTCSFNAVLTIKVWVCLAYILLQLFSPVSILAAEDKTRMVVAGDHDFPPFEFLENGKPKGFNIDLIRAVAEVMDIEIEIRLGPWNEARQALENGKIDIITGMSFSEKRDLLFDFSVPHTMIFPGLFVRSDSSIHEYEDIVGKDIVVEEGDIMHDYSREVPFTFNIITVATLPEALKLISSGKYDGALLSSELMKNYIANKFAYTNLREVSMDLPPRDYCFAVAEGNRALLYKLDQGLNNLRSTGAYQDIYNKWFGVYEMRDWWETIKYFVLALVLIVACFIVSLFWSWSLKNRVRKKTSELRNSEQELRATQAELEQRVEERTADLAKANKRLRSEIIERDKIETALRESEAEYRAIVESFDGLIYICSSDYRIEFMNKPLIERTGRDATGEPCYEVLHDRDSVCPWCLNDRVMQGETVRWELQSPKDNRWYYVVNTPICHSDGSISKQAMIQDITERVDAEREKLNLEVQNQQLQKVKSLDRMAGAIAHHFNNKLHVVMGYLELASDTVSQDNKTAQYLKEAIEAADKAAEVSRSMLTYLGKVTEKQAPLDLSEVCSKSLALIQTVMPKHLVLETSFLSPGPAVKANENQLQLILTNILRNSWEAIGDNQGTIHLSVKTVPSSKISSTHRFPINWQANEKEYACLEVRDTGCGITTKDLEAAFDPFFSTKFTGRGLGLSVVLGLVQSHNGGITVESTPGQGSVISVLFPIVAEHVPSQPERVVSAVEIEGTGTVLLVDDDKIVLLITGELLSMMGFKVLTAMDGVEALEIFQQFKDEIRFVVSDIAMPRMNGLEMLKALRQITPGIPVILASGYSEEQVMSIAHSERAQAFLEKPFGSIELQEAIVQALADRPEEIS